MTEETHALEIDPSVVGTLDLEGARVPCTSIRDEAAVQTQLLVGTTTYRYERSFPVRGHSAVLPQVVAELEEEGKQVLIAERGERYLVYAT